MRPWNSCPLRRTALAAVASFPFLLPVGPASADEPGDAVEAVEAAEAAEATKAVAAEAPEVAEASLHERLAREAEALVTVKFVLNVSMEGAGADQEFEGETTCLTIDPKGLILCSSTELGGYVGLMGRLMGSDGGSMSAVAKEIEILPGDGGEGIAARLLVRDSDRDLAWLQVEDEPGAPLPFLDLSRATELGLGDEFYRVRRMDKFFGRVPLVEQGTIGAVTEKPRHLLVPSQALAGGFGLPVFDADGGVAGVTVVQLPGAEDQLSGLLGGSMMFLSTAVQLQDMVGGLVLPTSEVVRATELAREIAAEEEAE
jgi:hypothetical protein